MDGNYSLEVQQQGDLSIYDLNTALKASFSQCAMTYCYMRTRIYCL